MIIFIKDGVLSDVPDNVCPFLWTRPQRYHVERPQAVFEQLSTELPAPCYPACVHCPPNRWAPMVNVTLVGESVLTCADQYE